MNNVTQAPKTLSEKVQDEMGAIEILKANIRDYQGRIRRARSDIWLWLKVGEYQHVENLMRDCCTWECNIAQDRVLIMQAHERVRRIRMQAWAMTVVNEAEKD